MVLTDKKHISDLLMDDVYVFQELYKQTDVTSTLKNVYFNIHKAVKVVQKSFLTNLIIIFKFPDVSV